MTNFKLTALAALLGLGIVGCLPASVLINVPGTSDIFLAGQTATAGNTTPACTTANLGCLPPVLNFLPVAGNVLTFTGPGIATGQAVTGTVSPCPACGSVGPDGANLGSQPPATNISSSSTTLSGIQYTGDEFFLIGVFLGASLPGSQVASIGDYGNGASGISPTQTTYSPLIGQTFFIGDGLTGNQTGALQQFIVPTGATNLYLGFADAMLFVGQAGMYNDNTGSLAVNLQIMPTSTPEPGSVAMMALGLAALLIGRRKLVA
jgi:hypothetical protein